MAAVCALGSCSRMMPLRAICEPLGQQFQFLLRRHLVPVAGPEVGAEHRDAALLQIVERLRRHFEVGKAKERRGRRRGGGAVKRRFDRRDALVDLAGGVFRLHVFQIAMGPGVVPDGVALGRDRCAPVPDAPTPACRSGRMWRARIPAPAPLSTLGVVAGPRPVVEGQHHLVVFQRQRLRKALQADAR